MPGPAFAEEEDGVSLRVRVTTQAAQDAVAGVAADADGQRRLAVRVRAAPQNGEANAAVEAVLAKALGVAKSSVSVVRGQTDRRKVVRIVGGPELAARLRGMLGENA